MVITEPTVVSEWLLRLGSKLYPRNMLGMLHKDLTPFLFGIHQNRTSERKALLAGCLRSSVMLQQGLVGNNTVYVTNRTSVCIVLMGFYNQMCFWYNGFSWSNICIRSPVWKRSCNILSLYVCTVYIVHCQTDGKGQYSDFGIRNMWW